MREILFRGKRKDGGGFVYGFYASFEIEGELAHGIIPLKTDIDNNDTTDEELIVDPKTIGQYIGVKDRKGVKIFEDDIIEYFHFSKITKKEVKFNSEIIGFDPFCVPVDYDEIYLRKDTVEVIGNTHNI